MLQTISTLAEMLQISKSGCVVDLQWCTIVYRAPVGANKEMSRHSKATADKYSRTFCASHCGSRVALMDPLCLKLVWPLA